MADEEPREPLEGSEESTADLTAKEVLEQPVPGFHLRQKIGEGGMGEVYEAEQLEPVRRRVALKLIKPGLESKEVLARFESERQALALMSHPNIAQVYGAGTTTDGRPYFVMEFVQGVSVTKYCDKHRLTTNERLTLFTQICDGVQHAHHKGIIHRDLKPSNVLVMIQDSKPVPKIIDFGVAKATSQRLTEKTLFTALGQFIGTPEYMSPEQAEMTELDIDTRTDVYSLGVVLYELLVGAQPFDSKKLRASGFDEMRRRIREDDPPRPSVRITTLGEASSVSAKRRRTVPSALAKELRGDLDWITMKAMDKDRTRRYGSPAELAADISRHLKHEPVEAGPPSALYRATKFVRRHRVGVLVVAAAVLLLLGLTARERIQSVRIAQERDRANQEAETANRVSNFLVSMFEVPDPARSKGESVTAREILDLGAESIDYELSNEPEVRSRLMDVMARSYSNLGFVDRGLELAEESRHIRLQYGGENTPELVDSLLLLSMIEHFGGDYEASERHAREALDRLRSGDQERPEQESIALKQLAIALKTRGELDEAEELYREALAIRRAVSGEHHQEIVSTMTSLAELLRVQGRLDEAEMMHREALTLARQVHGEIHPEISGCLNNLGLVLHDKEDFEAAEQMLREALELDRRLYHGDHQEIAGRLNNLAALLKTMERYEEAESMHREALVIRRRLFGENHPEVAGSLNNLSVLLTARGEYDEAEQLQREALAIVRSLLGDNHPNVGISYYNLGKLLQKKQDWPAAEIAYLEALPILDGTLPEGNWRKGEVRSLIGVCIGKSGRYEEAEEWLLTGHEMVVADRGTDDPRSRATAQRLVELYEALGRPQQAEKDRKGAVHSLMI